MNDRQKEKFIQLDEEQGVWLIGKGKKATPPEARDDETPQQEVAAAPADPVEIIRAALAESAAAAASETPQEPESNYATDFPLPLTQPGRRGPGPSLEMFKDMARQVKRTGF